MRSVLLDALIGLVYVYLHDHGVIHSDVKPQHILVDRRERGYVDDFYISIDARVRKSAAHLNTNTVMSGTQDAWTTGFVASELISSRQVTRHTDIFAYGKTVLAVDRHFQTDDGSHTHGSGSDCRIDFNLDNSRPSGITVSYQRTYDDNPLVSSARAQVGGRQLVGGSMSY